MKESADLSAQFVAVGTPTDPTDPTLDPEPSAKPATPKGDFEAAIEGNAQLGNNTIATAAGTMTLKLSHESGKISAKIVLQSGSLSFKAKAWDNVLENGTGYVVMTSRSGEVLTLFLLDNTLHGTLSGGRFGDSTLSVSGSRNRFADRADTEAATKLALLRGIYTIALPNAGSTSDDPHIAAAPEGVGYLSLNVAARGKVRITGMLADGTRVSRSATLRLADNNAKLPLLVPLYAKRGNLSGNLTINIGNLTIIADDAGALFWHNPGRRPGTGFTQTLEVCGGLYNVDQALQGLSQLLFGTTLGATSFYDTAGIPQPWVVEPGNVAVEVIGNRLRMTKGAAPKRVKDDDTIRFEYDIQNPCSVTMALAGRSGIFKGKFTLWADYVDDREKIQHKKLAAKHFGILIHTRDN